MRQQRGVSCNLCSLEFLSIVWEGFLSALWMGQFYNFTGLVTICLGPPDNFRLEAKNTFPKKVTLYCCQENYRDVSMKSLGTELCLFTLLNKAFPLPYKACGYIQIPEKFKMTFVRTGNNLILTKDWFKILYLCRQVIKCTCIG